MRIISWNVNGIRAIERKGFPDWLEAEAPDMLCLQETKASPGQLSPALRAPPGYHAYWHSAEKRGYSGVVTYSRAEPLGISTSMGAEEFDIEGRMLMTEYEDFALFNVYFPNGKARAERLAYKLYFYDRFLEMIDAVRGTGKGVIFCGDLNTAHRPIDLTHPRANENTSGFLPVERAWIDRVLEHGYVDTFRHFDDSPEKYTWWDYKTRARERNVGWRLDYLFVSEDMLPRLKDAFIMSDVMGSDHCPVGITLD